MEQRKRLLVRDIMHCRPGRVRPMVEKFLALADAYERNGWGRMRVLTDMAAERYWTAVVETEVESLEAYERAQEDPAAAEAMNEFMQGYHEFVEGGRREIFTIERPA
jgi:hypothetical protein